jgi:hypothetical protein
MILTLGKKRRRLGQWRLVAVVSLAAVAGCGKPGNKVVSGQVTCEGQSVETGQVRFVPIENTRGPLNWANITDGQYRMETRGGVPVGIYRVEVDAKKKTGRKVRGHIGPEVGIVDELVRLGPEVYAGASSPLKLKIDASFDGRFDIEIPAR